MKNQKNNWNDGYPKMQLFLLSLGILWFKDSAYCYEQAITTKMAFVLIEKSMVTLFNCYDQRNFSINEYNIFRLNHNFYAKISNSWTLFSLSSYDPKNLMSFIQNGKWLHEISSSFYKKSCNS